MTEPQRPTAAEPLPAWSLARDDIDAIRTSSGWPDQVTREWAWGDSTGAGAHVCVLDSGVEASHPDVGDLERALRVTVNEDGEGLVEEDDGGDIAGHGTACAGIIRQLAPGCAITSLRVLGRHGLGSSPALLAGLRWAVEQDFDVLNLSLSTPKREAAAILHELADSAYFKRTLLVASANNMATESFPWRFSSVISVGSHDRSDPFELYYNPSPPAEFFARGVGVEVPWRGGVRMTTTGNSFAAAHVSGLCALLRSKHPELTGFQVKNVLHLLAANVGPQ